jgi:mRNA-degrading endonuclease RelE of RelBE toxin-antitoxin system
MAATRREIIIAPRAFATMEAARPSEAEREALREVLAELSTDLARAYRIPFENPPSYRIDVGRFRIHFRLDDTHLRVGFIGVY